MKRKYSFLPFISWEIKQVPGGGITTGNILYLHGFLHKAYRKYAFGYGGIYYNCKIKIVGKG